MSELSDQSKSPTQLMQIKCTACSHVGKEKYWGVRNLINFLLVIIPILAWAYAIWTNPYVCEKCNQRNYLIKILNNKKEIPIKSIANKPFLILSILLLTVSIIINIMIYNFYKS